MSSKNLGRKLGKREKAIKIANVVLREIGKGIGVIGGAKRNGEKGIIRETDRTLLNKEGLCYPHRAKEINGIDIKEYDIPYRVPPEIIKKIIPDISYISGLSVANPLARVAMHKFPIDEINEVTLGEIIKKAKVPIVVDILSSSKERYYQQRVEDFRVSLDRPHWVLRIVNFDYPWITKGKDGNVKKLSLGRIKNYLSRVFVPEATGIEWVIDYGILALLPNPSDEDRKVVLVGGAHWLSTFTLNAMLYLVERIPELNLEIEGAIDSMRWLFDAVYNRIEFFEAIFRVTDSCFRRRRKIDIDPIGLFTLDHSNEKIMEKES